MSKIKEQQLKEQDNLLEYYCGFYEWLESLKLHTLSDNDIKKLEETQLRASSVNKPIVSTQMLNINKTKDVA